MVWLFILCVGLCFSMDSNFTGDTCNVFPIVVIVVVAVLFPFSISNLIILLLLSKSKRSLVQCVIFKTFKLESSIQISNIRIRANQAIAAAKEEAKNQKNQINKKFHCFEARTVYNVQCVYIDEYLRLFSTYYSIRCRSSSSLRFGHI